MRNEWKNENLWMLTGCACTQQLVAHIVNAWLIGGTCITWATTIFVLVGIIYFSNFASLGNKFAYYANVGKSLYSCFIQFGNTIKKRSYTKLHGQHCCLVRPYNNQICMNIKKVVSLDWTTRLPQTWWAST